MKIIRVLMIMLLVLTTVSAQGQNRRHRTDWKGTGASVYDLDSDLPEDAAVGKGAATVSVDTIKQVSEVASLIQAADVDARYQFNATSSSPLDKVEIIGADGKVLRSMGLHKSTKATIDLNAFPKDQTLNIKFYGVNGQTQTIEMSH